MAGIGNLGIFNNYSIQAPGGVNFRGVEHSGYLLQTNPLSRQDSYTSDIGSVDFEDKKHIEKLAKSNPRIMSMWQDICNLLNEPRAKLTVNINELQQLKKGHLQDSRRITALIYSNLPEDLRAETDMKTLQKAAYLHDYGKVLIPEKILNKNGMFTDNEKKVMDMHSEFGYELLRMQGVDEKVLKLIKYHHQMPDGSGYSC